MLNVENLSIGIKRAEDDLIVVNQLNFSVEKGQTLALVGESGSGKTLTALAIPQLLPQAADIFPSSSIIFDDQDLLTYSEIQMRKIRGRRIGVIFQEAMAVLNPVLTIEQQLQEILVCHFDYNRKKRVSRIYELLDHVGIRDSQRCAKCYPHQLSGGMKQRVMIAMALAGEPELLIADEPTTSIDASLQKQILTLIKQIQKRHKMGLIFISHDLSVVRDIADDVVVLKKGVEIEYAKKDVFFKTPTHEYSQSLLNAIPTWAHRNRPATSTTDQSPLLSVKGLKKYFPIQKGMLKRKTGDLKAVDGISFKLYPGRTLAVVGESGSGKTTLGRSVFNLIKPTAGEVVFPQFYRGARNQSALATQGEHSHTPLEYPHAFLDQIYKNMQMIFQDPFSAMNPRMLVKQIIQEGMQYHALSAKEKDVLTAELLDCVGLLPEHQYRYPHEFSGGQRQRICIARALAVQPKILICDEITSSLDVSIQMQILDLLSQLQAKFDLAYLFITHNLGVVSCIADDVLVMHEGKCVEIGSVEDVLKHPQHAYTKKLLAAVSC